MEMPFYPSSRSQSLSPFDLPNNIDSIVMPLVDFSGGSIQDLTSTISSTIPTTIPQLSIGNTSQSTSVNNPSYSSNFLVNPLKSLTQEFAEFLSPALAESGTTQSSPPCPPKWNATAKESFVELMHQDDPFSTFLGIPPPPSSEFGAQRVWSSQTLSGSSCQPGQEGPQDSERPQNGIDCCDTDGILSSLLKDSSEQNILAHLRQYLTSSQDVRNTTSNNLHCGMPCDGPQLMPKFNWLNRRDFIYKNSSYCNHGLDSERKSVPITRMPSTERLSTNASWRSGTPTPRSVHSQTVDPSPSFCAPLEDFPSALYSTQQSLPPTRKCSVREIYHRGKHCQSSRVRYTQIGKTSFVPLSCSAVLPLNMPRDGLAPLHIVLPINIPYGKIVVQSNSHTNRGHPIHHYYFRRQFPSANQLFSRLHGLCNQSPSWLTVDVGYVACREYQVPFVVDLFNNYFRQSFQNIAQRNRSLAIQDSLNHPQDGSENISNTNSNINPSNNFFLMNPIRLTCSGLRLRSDHGSGWFLYETPVISADETDSFNFKEVIQIIESFCDRVRSSRLCQNATMKPFMNDQFAIVVLKQEGKGLSDRELARVSNFSCEGVEISEVRLVRHKRQDRFCNAMFEEDPRFNDKNVLGRPIAHNHDNIHGRYVFAKAALPPIISRPSHRIHPTMAELEQDSEVSDFGDDI